MSNHLLEKAEQDREKLQIRYERLQKESEYVLQELEKVAYTVKFIRENSEPNASFSLVPIEPTPNLLEDYKEDNLSFVSGSVFMLKKMKQPMHARELADQFNRVGKETNARLLATNLRTDPKERFRNVGENTWVLSEWEEF